MKHPHSNHSLKRAGWGFCAFALLCYLFAPGLHLVQAGLVEPSPDTILANRTSGPFVIGFDFAVDAETTINALGVEDNDGDGLKIATAAGLWDISAVPSVEIATVTIPLGTEAILEDGFRYIATEAPITLLPGKTYRIGAVAGGDIPFTDTASAGGGGSGFSGAGVTILTNRFASGGLLTEPVNDGTLDPGRWAGANATLLTTEPDADPEIIAVAYAGPALDQSVEFTWLSIPDAAYRVARSPDLSLPFDLWEELDDGFPSGGAETTYFDDTLDANTPAMFYRVRQN